MLKGSVCIAMKKKRKIKLNTNFKRMPILRGEICLNWMTKRQDEIHELYVLTSSWGTLFMPFLFSNFPAIEKAILVRFIT